MVNDPLISSVPPATLLSVAHGVATSGNPQGSGSTPDSAIQVYSLTGMRFLRKREPASAKDVPVVKEMSYFHLTRTQGRKTCGSKAQRNGGVASKHEVPLGTTSVLISLVPWNSHS